MCMHRVELQLLLADGFTNVLPEYSHGRQATYVSCRSRQRDLSTCLNCLISVHRLSLTPSSRIHGATTPTSYRKLLNQTRTLREYDYAQGLQSGGYGSTASVIRSTEIETMMAYRTRRPADSAAYDTNNTECGTHLTSSRVGSPAFVA